MDSNAVTRLLVAVYARERIEDAIRGVAEDALSPGRSGCTVVARRVRF